MYAIVCMQPYLCHMMSVVIRYMENLGKNHWDIVKWVLRYLRGITLVGLKYGVGKQIGAYMMGYIDSEYAGDLDTRKSLTWYIFKVCGNTVC